MKRALTSAPDRNVFSGRVLGAFLGVGMFWDVLGMFWDVLGCFGMFLDVLGFFGGGFWMLWGVFRFLSFLFGGGGGGDGGLRL